MNQANQPTVSTTLTADAIFLPLATAFTEQAALAMGLGNPEALSLTLAVEELFAHLCRVADPQASLVITCRRGATDVRIDIEVAAGIFDMQAFNLTCQVCGQDDQALEQIGLVLASRSVDRLWVTAEKGRGLRLSLIKEKAYPALTATPVPPTRPMQRYRIAAPAPEALIPVAQLAAAHCAQTQIHPMMGFAGKLVDAMAGGELQAALAMDEAGAIGGAILWRWASDKTVEFFGPYLFGQANASDMAAELVEHCIAAISRTSAIGMFSRWTTADLPAHQFEAIGTLTLAGRNATVVYRQLGEDLGSALWCHRDIGPWVEKTVAELFLPRHIHLLSDQGQSEAPSSVLAAEMDRARHRATLRPVLAGRDMAANLDGHLNLLCTEGFTGIFFEMDLADAGHSAWSPALLAAGFQPRVFLPHAGRGDIVVFQWMPADPPSQLATTGAGH